jgi:hypothetical protein
VRANIEKDLIARKHPQTPLIQSHLDRLRPYEASFAHDQLDATRLVKFEVKTDFTFDHPALPGAHSRHFDRHALSNDSKLRSVARQLCNFGAVNDVLARQAGDIRARSADQLPLDHRGTPAGSAHRPSQILARFAAADDE